MSPEGDSVRGPVIDARGAVRNRQKRVVQSCRISTSAADDNIKTLHFFELDGGLGG